MIRVKICGIRRTEEALAAAGAGASLLGFNFWKGTPRYVSPHEVARIVAVLPKGLETVGVFVNETPERVLEIAGESGVSMLQFHGTESPEYWERFASFQRIKAFKVGAGFEADDLNRYSSAAAFLLDGSAEGLYGGTGKTFDWSLAEKAKEFGRIIVAGGLNAGNVAEAVRRVRPWGVDVASGVESEPGKKDLRLIREFIQAVREAESEQAPKRPLRPLSHSRP
jgi:phosphoribosylanthranilate isomerase